MILKHARMNHQARLGVASGKVSLYSYVRHYSAQCMLGPDTPLTLNRPELKGLKNINFIFPLQNWWHNFNCDFIA